MEKKEQEQKQELKLEELTQVNGGAPKMKYDPFDEVVIPKPKTEPDKIIKRP